VSDAIRTAMILGGTIIFLIILNELDERRKNYGPSQNHNKPRDHPNEATSPKPPSSSPHPTEEEYRAKEQAHWDRQHCVEVAAVILSGLVAIGAITSAIFAYKALTASQDVARSARDQAEQAKRQADAAARSYVFVAFGDGRTILNWTFQKGLIEISIRLTNFGTGPAVIQRVGCAIAWGAENGPPSDAISVARNDSMSVMGVNHLPIPPTTVIAGRDSLTALCLDGWPRNDRTLGATDAETVPNRRRLINSGIPIWVAGVVDYADVAGDRHFTNFCAKNDGGIDLTPGGVGECQNRN